MIKNDKIDLAENMEKEENLVKNPSEVIQKYKNARLQQLN